MYGSYTQTKYLNGWQWHMRHECVLAINEEQKIYILPECVWLSDVSQYDHNTAVKRNTFFIAMRLFFKIDKEGCCQDISCYFKIN